ncbi:PREDICTED: RNA-binding protein NOB1 [Cyprinodon variegatus]|uniref:RNA-binding protein NOB1 n=1 Tax=Cyprinodon variegatus TaxID=28743 RepID=UPI000742765D|nr:PREDICTED: RNA-binding protein NOB1 [Cyprinodon variegatus]
MKLGEVLVQYETRRSSGPVMKLGEVLVQSSWPPLMVPVTEFSKKTGDYPSLSATDIKVLALTYQLELEHVGPDHLKTEPELKVNVQSTRRHPEAPVNIAGFHFPSKRSADGPAVGHVRNEAESPDQSDQFNSFQFWRDPLPSIQGDLLELLGPTESLEADVQQMVPDGHFNSFQFWRDPLPCIDDDLLALLVRSSIILLPTGSVCSFSPKTGSEPGGPRLTGFCFLSVLQHSLPLPQGGKHANNPHLVEDQRFPQQRLSRKARQKTDVFDPDYLAGTAPFCQNDIYSRAANLQIRDGQSGAGRRRANPNAARKKFVKKK